MEVGLAERSAGAMGRAFFRALGRYGVSAIYARAFPAFPSTAEHVFARISPPGWESLYAERDFASVNYLGREAGHRAEAFAWSDIRLADPAEIALSRALADCGFPDGLAIPCHGPGGYSGVTSLAFAALHEIAPAERVAIEMAALVLHHRMRSLAPPGSVSLPSLSARERDCLRFLIDGRTDGEIADAMGISTTTVITHIQNLRRKLGARNRTQAAALAVAHGLL